MRQTTNTQSQGQQRKSTQPKGDYEKWSASSPIEYEVNGEQKTYWQDLGTGFKTEKGIMLRLNALPTNGRIFIQPAQTKETN